MLVLGRKRWTLDQYLYHSEVNLENCWKLSMVEDPALSAVSIVKDLTARHRAGEKEMYKEAARKNLSHGGGGDMGQGGGHIFSDSAVNQSDVLVSRNA